MNAHWALTKDQDRLMETLENKDNKRVNIFSNLIKNYSNHWKTPPEWYKLRYDQYYEIENVPGISAFNVHCNTAYVTGSGLPSVLEAHLTLHRIYGVPYLPASSLKGLTAHYYRQHAGVLKLGQDFDKIVFGSQEQAGFVTFYDAFPTPDTVGSALHLDVLTPHHQKYNTNMSSDGKRLAPRDDDSPVPVHFLSAKASFRIMISCEGTPERAKPWLNAVQTLITHALQHEGFGGKTNAGYGRFSE